MINQIFANIDEFELWAESQFKTSLDYPGGEWECDYDNWKDIYKSFEEFIKTSDPSKLTSTQRIEYSIYNIERQ